MGWAHISGILVALCVVVYFVDAGYLPRVPSPYREGMPPKKRPFCNAFTGCGRKRADTSVPVKPETRPQSNAINGIDDTLGDLLDLNSEPAVEDLMRQIMSQAKMWEAIQEANREMTIQKNDRINLNNQNPMTFPTVQFNTQ